MGIECAKFEPETIKDEIHRIFSLNSKKETTTSIKHRGISSTLS